MTLSAAPGRALLLAALGAGLVIVGASGAVAALGDTLFPASSLRAALDADLSATSHTLIRLRIWHPAVAILVALAVGATAPWLSRTWADARHRRLGHVVAGLAITQIAVGFVNVLLLAPVWMQLGHLLLADALWIAFVLHATTVLPARAGIGARAPHRPDADATETAALSAR